MKEINLLTLMIRDGGENVVHFDWELAGLLDEVLSPAQIKQLDALLRPVSDFLNHRLDEFDNGSRHRRAV